MGTHYNRLTEVFLTCTPINVLSKNKKDITFFHLNITICTAVKYRSILHRHVIVMPGINYPPVLSAHSFASN